MKAFRMIIVAMLVLGLTCCPFRALALSSHSAAADFKQQEIDELFTQLNELAAEERMLSVMQESELSAMNVNNTTRLESINSRQASLENQLERLGVHTIDPGNPEDMAQLQEVVLGNAAANNTASIPDPPNLEAFADCYTISQYNGSIDVNGVSYAYSYIYVTDNKSYEDTTLTETQTTNILIGKESTILQDILEYQFSFAFSSYLGAIPYGWIADWTIGTVFSVLNSLNENSNISYSGNSNIYNMSMVSVTQMTYCYVYLPNSGWILCGVKAPNISYARAEYLVANIGGTAYSEATSYPTQTSSTGIPALSYVRNYINGSGCVIDRIGSLQINTYGGTYVRFTPGFAPHPLYLM